MPPAALSHPYVGGLGTSEKHDIQILQSFSSHDWEPDKVSDTNFASTKEA